LSTNGGLDSTGHWRLKGGQEWACSPHCGEREQLRSEPWWRNKDPHSQWERLVVTRERGVG
jgi:hypothetical protein